MYTTIGDAVKTTVKPTAGELDQEEISRVSDLLVDPEGTQGKPRNGIDSFVSEGYYNQVKAQSNISPSEFDKRFEYLVEGGEANGFGVANQIITDNPTATDEELKVSLLKVKDELGLSVTDINSMIATRATFLSESRMQEIATVFVKSLNSTDKAITAIEAGKVELDGKIIELSEEQITKIIDMIRKQRTRMQKLIPGGK